MSGHRRTLPRFLMVGVINTIVGYGIIFVAMRFFAFGPYLANTIGYGIALMVSFALNLAWTFGSREKASKTFPLFLLVFAIAWVANLAAVAVAIEIFRSGMWLVHLAPIEGVRRALGSDYLAQLCGIPAYVSMSYLLNRYYTFADQSSAREGAQ